MSRTRKCLKGTEYVDPKYCSEGIDNGLVVGEKYNETKECNTLMCANWGAWQNGPCSRKCGGTLVRTRMCKGLGFERPQIFDARPDVCTRETIDCARPDCDAIYEEWSAWSECSTTRGLGIQERNRVCVSKSSSPVVPQKDQSNCKHLGEPNEIKTCYYSAT